MIHQSTGSQLLFLSDSLSCLQSLQNRDLSLPLIAEILCRVHGLIPSIVPVKTVHAWAGVCLYRAIRENREFYLAMVACAEWVQYIHIIHSQWLVTEH